MDIVKLAKNLVIMPKLSWDGTSTVLFTLFSFFLKQAVYFIFFCHLEPFLVESIYASLVRIEISFNRIASSGVAMLDYIPNVR